jgi:hypothetical protein
LGKGNISEAEKYGADDCDGQLEEHSKATIDINDHECNVITDTEDDIGIIFQLEGKDVKVSIRDFGSYVKFNKECYHKGYKNSEVNTYLTAQLFAPPAARQKWHRLKSMNITGRYEKKRLKENSCQFRVASEMKSDVENNLGMSEYDMNGILRCKIQFRS